jgi:hypothetical protein
VLKGIPIELQKGQPLQHATPADQTYAWIYDTLCDWLQDMMPVPSDALLLKEGFYSMTCDYRLSDYIMWPLYQEKSSIKEPFEPYYQLWIRGAGLRFTGETLLTVYAPALLI